MEQTRPAHRWRLPVVVGIALIAIVLLRHVLAALATQLLAAAALMLLALPLCKALERRVPAGAAAVLALLSVAALVLAALALALPPFLRQVQQLATAVPALMETLRGRFALAAGWLDARGIDIGPARDEAFAQLTTFAGSIAGRLMAFVGRMAGTVSQLLLSPLLAFYLLRDRVRLASWLTLALPVDCRTRGVRAAREMRRETAAYLRGQLLLSLAVGGLTAFALLLTGTPGWLLLGVLMGVLELVPYVGPFLAGVPAVLMALQGGLGAAVWTAGALVVVQQVEGGVLSPRLLGGATRLHPMVVLMLVSAGGLLAGPLGMILAVPVVVAIRGGVRGWRD